MIPSLRQQFNTAFTKEKYEAFLEDLHKGYPGAIEFRVAETPVFVSRGFAEKLYDACESIIDLICSDQFKNITHRAIPETENVPNEKEHCHMIAFDFGVCTNASGELEPQLIEMQGFPSLFGFQVYYPEVMRRHFNIPESFSQYLGNYTKESYTNDLRDVILGHHKPENVILLEIKPHEQKTRIDFYCTRDLVGIHPVCITELIQEGKKLFYIHPETKEKTAILRIYNRVIFDDLKAHKETLGKFVDITQELEVEWVPHPNWFNRISKFTLPFIKHPYVPTTYFLNEIKQMPADLENYVLKPLFSFAGQGVVIDVTREDIDQVKDPENWILQKKVTYAEVIDTPDIPAKAELRLMYLWKEDWARPKPAINLARLSKGKMIGVRYNKDKEWVGGSTGLFEK